jgi:hypothetical protein
MESTRTFFTDDQLLGDVLTWAGLALLAYQIDKEPYATILATVLTRIDTLRNPTIIE